MASTPPAFVLLRFLPFAAMVTASACLPPPYEGGMVDERRDPLDANWLDGETNITPSRLARVLALGAEDANVRALEGEARERLGGGRFEGLAERFRPCSPAEAQEGGLTELASSDVFFPRTIEELHLERLSPRLEDELQKAKQGAYRDLRVEERRDYVMLRRVSQPDICISPGLAFIDAYEAIVHELVHALRSDPYVRLDLARAVHDEPTYLARVVALPGGEIEAFRFGVAARLRVRYGGRRVPRMLHLFDVRTGQPRVSNDEIGAFILRPRPEGLGYETTILRGEFRGVRSQIARRLVNWRESIERMLEERRANIAILTRNLGVHEHNSRAHRRNLEIARIQPRGDLRQRSVSGLEAAEAGLVRTRAMLEAARGSEARLAEELAQISNEQQGAEPAAPPSPGAAPGASSSR